MRNPYITTTTMTIMQRAVYDALERNAPLREQVQHAFDCYMEGNLSLSEEQVAAVAANLRTLGFEVRT